MALANDKALRYQRIASRLDDAGRWAREKSAAKANLLYGNATRMIEQWTALTAWSSTSAVQVANGKVYGNGGGAGSGINYPLDLGTSGVARFVSSIELPSAPTSGGVMIGVSSGTPGAAPGGGGGTARAIYFTTSGVYTIDNGAQSAKVGDYYPGVWPVTVSVDAELITVSATAPNGATEFRGEWARSGFDVRNLYVFNSDARGLTGLAVGPIGGTVGAISTVTPRTRVEGLGKSVITARSGNGSAKLLMPADYDPRVPRPLVIMWHGNGSDQHIFTDNQFQKAIIPALMDAGYLVLSATHSLKTTWGSQQSLDVYAWAYRWAREVAAIGSVSFFANSMGSIEALNALSQQSIPGVVAYVGHSPTANLAQAHGNATFTSLIRNAYGVATDGSDYAAKTAGYDPVLMDGRAFRGLPMLFLAATDDTVIPKASHTDVLVPLVTPYASKVEVVSGITGGHSFDITPYTAKVVSFLRDYTGA